MTFGGGDGPICPKMSALDLTTGDFIARAHDAGKVLPEAWTSASTARSESDSACSEIFTDLFLFTDCLGLSSPCNSALPTKHAADCMTDDLVRDARPECISKAEATGSAALQGVCDC